RLVVDLQRPGQRRCLGHLRVLGDGLALWAILPQRAHLLDRAEQPAHRVVDRLDAAVVVDVLAAPFVPGADAAAAGEDAVPVSELRAEDAVRVVGVIDVHAGPDRQLITPRTGHRQRHSDAVGHDTGV